MPKSEDLIPGPMWRHVWYRLVLVALKVAMLLLGPVRAHDKRRVPRTGGLLILANHLADADPVAVQVSCRRRVTFMAKSELFGIRVLGRFIRWTGSFPVKRGEPDREALKKAVVLLKAGEAVCVFPEGQLSEDGNLQELKAGVGLIARMADCPVICCGIQNTNRIMPYGKLIPRPSFRTVHVRWGEPRKFDKGAEPAEIVAWAREQLLALTRPKVRVDR